jgi:hypothetical protein
MKYVLELNDAEKNFLYSFFVLSSKPRRRLEQWLEDCAGSLFAETNLPSCFVGWKLNEIRDIVTDI